MSKPLPQALTRTGSLAAGVNVNQTPLPKLVGHVGTGSPVLVAVEVSIVTGTAATNGMALPQVSFPRSTFMFSVPPALLYPPTRM